MINNWCENDSLPLRQKGRRSVWSEELNSLKILTGFENLTGLAMILKLFLELES